MRLVAGILFLLGVALPAQARVLIITFSDAHAKYGNLEGFLIGAARLREQFLRENPTGTVVLQGLGDLAGLSEWTRDEGELVLSLLEAQAPHYELVLFPGNHDGFDMNGATHDNAAIVRQLRSITRAVTRLRPDRRPFRLTNANLRLTPLGRELIAPYHDVPTAHGVVRFGGLVLDEFFMKSDYTFARGEQLFTGIQRGGDVLASLLQTAARTPEVRAFILSNHDRNDRVEIQRRHLHTLRRTSSAAQRLHLPGAFAAHDHEIAYLPGDAAAPGATIDSGAHFHYSSVVLEDDFTLGQPTFHSPTVDNPEDLSALRPSERNFLLTARPLVAAIARANSRVVGYAGRPLPPKCAVKRGPETSGIATANALNEWGLGVARALALSEHRRQVMSERNRYLLPVVSFFHSSSYRLEELIAAGTPITEGMIRAIYPMLGRPRLGRVTGAQLRDLYFSLRRSRFEDDQVYTPQLSSNLRENGDVLEYLGHPLSLDSEYLVVLDCFLARNPFELPAWKTLFRQVRWLNIPNTPHQQDIFVEFLAPYLTTADCSARLTAITAAARLAASARRSFPRLRRHSPSARGLRGTEGP